MFLMFNFSLDIWHYFECNCLKNLHCVLFLSTSNESIRHYCRIYPGLLNHTAFDRIAEWSTESLEMVANTFVREHLSIRDELVEPIDGHIVHVHKSVQFYSNQFSMKLHGKNLLTLRNLMDYIHTYLKLIGIYLLICIHHTRSRYLTNFDTLRDRWYARIYIFERWFERLHRYSHMNI